MNTHIPYVLLAIICSGFYLDAPRGKLVDGRAFAKKKAPTPPSHSPSAAPHPAPAKPALTAALVPSKQEPTVPPKPHALAPALEPHAAATKIQALFKGHKVRLVKPSAHLSTPEDKTRIRKAWQSLRKHPVKAAGALAGLGALATAGAAAGGAFTPSEPSSNTLAQDSNPAIAPDPSAAPDSTQDPNSSQS